MEHYKYTVTPNYTVAVLASVTAGVDSARCTVVASQCRMNAEIEMLINWLNS